MRHARRASSSATKQAKRPLDPALKLAERVFAHAHRNGIVFRAFADGRIDLAPALSCTDDEMEILLAQLAATLDATLEEAKVRAALAALARIRSG